MNTDVVQFRQLKMQSLRRLKQCLALAEQYFQRSFPMPEVSFDLRGTKAGVAYFQQNAVKFNRTLMLENAQAFIHQVVPHELAHLIVHQVFGQVRPHGKEWKMVMSKVFGLPPDRCHQFDVSNVSGRGYLYRCACQEHKLSSRRHHRIIRERIDYICRHCKTKLFAVNEN